MEDDQFYSEVAKYAHNLGEVMKAMAHTFGYVNLDDIVSEIDAREVAELERMYSLEDAR